MKDKILLTISILISDRPDTVEKCLQSLENLRENVPCELILTDTGCGEKVRGIIEKYADVILEFEWCRDFAKARNLGLDAARGEWFLYLDDDEWFEDTNEIEAFFQTGLYQKYGVALYLQRNYSNLKGTAYSDATVSRMVRLDKGVCFQYSIHETFQNMPGPVKLLHSYVHHYGYIYKNNYEKYKHSQRNLIPLLEEHENAPYNLRHNAQLAQEYNGIGEHTKSVEISLKGIGDYRGNKEGLRDLNSLFVNVVERYLKMYRYEDAVSYAEKFITDDRINRLGLARICTLIAEAFFELEQYEKCEKYCDVYMEIYEDYSLNEDWYISRAGLFISNSFEERIRNKTICFGISAILKLKKYKRAKELFDTIDFDSNVLVLEAELLKGIINAFVEEKLTETHPCVYMLSKLLGREQLHSKIIEYFEDIRRKHFDMPSKNLDKWRYLPRNCWYISYLSLDMENESGQSVIEQYKDLWRAPEKMLPQSIKMGIWEMAETIGVALGEVIGSIPYYKWENAVRNISVLLNENELEKINEYICKNCSEEMRHRKYWEVHYIKKQLNELEEYVEWQDVITKMTRFSKLLISLAEDVYKSEILHNHRDILPGEIQVAIYILEANECLNEKEYLQAISLLREVKDILPSFAVPVKMYTKFIEQQLNQQEQERKTNLEEMQRLEKAIKEKIQYFMKNSEFVIALQLIAQLELITGKNSELEEWKEICNSN